MELSGDVTMRDERTNDDDDKQLKIELLSQWKLEAESLPPAPQVSSAMVGGLIFETESN